MFKFRKQKKIHFETPLVECTNLETLESNMNRKKGLNDFFLHGDRWHDCLTWTQGTMFTIKLESSCYGFRVNRRRRRISSQIWTPKKRFSQTFKIQSNKFRNLSRIEFALNESMTSIQSINDPLESREIGLWPPCWLDFRSVARKR